MPRRRKPRGYPVAVLIGLAVKNATIWDIYSQSIRPDTIIKSETSEYNFFESIINQLRPKMKHGIKTILVASTDEKEYEKFYDHINKHQHWLISGYELNTITIEYVEGSATKLDDVIELVMKSGLQRTIQQAFQEDSKRVFNVLEKRLGTSTGIDTLLFTLKKVEEAVYGEPPYPEYILLTSDFRRKHINRVQRLLQFAENKGIKSMIVKAETPTGKRLTQFGGLISLKRIN